MLVDTLPVSTREDKGDEILDPFSEAFNPSTSHDEYFSV